MPVAEPIEARIVLLLLHEPPVGIQLNAVVVPGQTLKIPAILLGVGLTVIHLVVVQPSDPVNAINVVPGVMPVTNPVGVTEALVPLITLKVVGPEGSVQGVVLPTHTVGSPTIGAGKEYTVNNAVVVHPCIEVNVTVAELPPKIPVTIPVDDPMMATVVGAMLHVPASGSVRTIDEPWHTPGEDGLIAPGVGFTVITKDAAHSVVLF